ncbi:c-type cytochrome [Rhodobacter sp. NSM]|uniref:c-type cytochrome n=1 Tax=Rhodobacter sp. NSM TaxID=3457501 RepID=UPI003FD367F2
MRATMLLGGLAAAGALAGASVIFLGLYDTSARHGHWPIVSWALHTTFRNSVELRAPPEGEVPELTDGMARLGARHYDSACRMCHGAPGVLQSATVRAMLPAPPPIAQAVGDWKPNELGWIVREGVKMSGMPGWPSVRNDEVWPVVAFLTRVQTMTPEQYSALTGSAAADGPPGFGYCAGCHGTDGVSGNERIPRLDIQTPEYLEMALQTYRAGRRQSGYMAHAASAVPGETLRALAQRFAAGAAGSGGASDVRPAAGEAAGLDAAAAGGAAPLTSQAAGASHGSDEQKAVPAEDAMEGGGGSPAANDAQSTVAAGVAGASEGAMTRDQAEADDAGMTGPTPGSPTADAGSGPETGPTLMSDAEGAMQGAARAAAPPLDPVEQGRALAFALTGRRDVPACQSCHGPEAEKRRADTPSLSGQYRPYLEVQLRLWRDGTRGGGPRAELMTEAARRLSDDEIVALAAYYASLPAAAP